MLKKLKMSIFLSLQYTGAETGSKQKGPDTQQGKHAVFSVKISIYKIKALQWKTRNLLFLAVIFTESGTL
jgi:hypothetical protein